MKNKSKKLLLVSLSAVMLVACGGGTKNTARAGHYTYNTYLETKPKTWNTHDWETSDESYIPAFTEMGFYDLQLDAKKTGYEIVCEMAAELPVDVTSKTTDDEKDKYGYKGNLDKGFVWEIALNQNAVWEDGTPITADDYIESMKRQLDPKMINFRADSYYASSMVIANAERYFKQGRSTIEAIYDYIDKTVGSATNPKFTSGDVCKDGNYYINIGKYSPYVGSVFSNADTDTTLYTVLNNRSDTGSDALELAAQRITDACRYYCWKYENHDGDYKSDWDEVQGWSKLSSIKAEMMNFNINIDEFDDREVLVRTTKDTSPTGDTTDKKDTARYSTDALKKDLNTVVSALRGPNKPWAWACPLFGSVYNNFEQPWDGVDKQTNEETGVGLVKVDDYTIKLYLSRAMTELDLKFSLSSNWLVNVKLYDELTLTTNTGLVSTKYATPDAGVKGYMSFGPYKLESMEAGKAFRIVKNDKWYGYKDGNHVGQYQMDEIYTRIITDHNTALQEFEAGRLDDFGLNRNDMKTYGNSSRLTRTYESYTQKISMNSNRAKLLSRQTGNGNKTILANYNFRKGLSLSLNRNMFASQTTAGSKAFTSLLNDLYLTDVELGEMYRNTAQGKGVYDAVYGKLGGNPYAADYQEKALEESAQGYNFNMATFYVAKGIEEELKSTETGHLVAGNKIDIEFRVYDNESETTIDMLNFLTNAFSDVVRAAVEKLRESKVLAANQEITIGIQSQKDEDYYNSAKSGNYDLIFSTWGGAAINPVGLMQVYCDSTFESNCEYGFKGKQDSEQLTIKFTDGHEETKSFHAWWSDAQGIVENDEHGSAEYIAKHNRILDILAGIEAGVLNRFEAVPLVARATSSLNSFKIENGSSTYINLIGYGGVRHMTFNFDDAEWAAFCKKYNNKLSNLYRD